MKKRIILKKSNTKKIDTTIIIKIIVLLAMIVLLIVSSYSWFADNSNPTITGSQIKVTAADGLIIKLEPDSPARTLVSLNQLFSDFDEFELQQVSSVDGETFYKIDFGQGLAITNPEFIELDMSSHSNSLQYGFIDYDFYLETEDYPKHVYLHKDTLLSGIADKAMRICISTDDFHGNTTNTIFGTTEENGVTAPFTTRAVLAEGEFQYNNINPSFLGNQYVKTFANKNGGRETSDSDPIDLNKVLLTIPANSQAKVNVKIWLEGGDIDCDNTISSSNLDLLLKFGSANVLLPAPSVSSNIANYTITNLTTDMEWAISNDASTIWTPVTDPNMTFVGKHTVYVRVAEVPGTSTASYVTTVNF